MEQYVLDMLTQRRSIRKFTGAPVDHDKLEVILRAAMCAPSARNQKPWKFLVITNSELIKKVCLAHPHAHFGTNAGAVIIPFGEKDSYEYFDQDMAACTQNILLMVAGMGLGATWCGMNAERQAAVKQVVSLPEQQWAFALIPVGVPAEELAPRSQFDPLRIYWERYA